MKNTKINIEEIVEDTAGYQSRSHALDKVKKIYPRPEIGIVVVIASMIGSFIVTIVFDLKYGFYITIGSTVLAVAFYFLCDHNRWKKVKKLSNIHLQTIDKVALRKQIVCDKIAELSKEVKESETALDEKKALLHKWTKLQ